MNTEKILKEMRECYLKKDFDGLRRKYYLSKAFLKEEDRIKIEKVLQLEKQKIVALVLQEMGGRITHV